MAGESISTDISAAPELARLAHDVADSGKMRVLSEHGVALAVVSPAASRRRSSRLKPLDRDNPIWEIVGAISADVGSDVSENVDRYLAGTHTAEPL